MNQNQQLDKVRPFNWSLILKTEQENLSQLLLLLLIVVVWLLEFDIRRPPGSTERGGTRFSHGNLWASRWKTCVRKGLFSSSSFYFFFLFLWVRACIIGPILPTARERWWGNGSGRGGRMSGHANNAMRREWEISTRTSRKKRDPAWVSPTSWARTTLLAHHFITRRVLAAPRLLGGSWLPFFFWRSAHTFED